MMRLFFLCACTISLMAASCNNNEVKNGEVMPGEEKQLRDLTIQYPDSPLLKENLVEYLRAEGNYEKAIAETDAVLKNDSLNDRFLEIKATLHFENSDTSNAIKAFEKAVFINPRAQYIMSLGSLYAQTKNPSALKMADALLQAPNENKQEQGLFIKGLYYNYTGDKIKAIPFFDSCIKIDYRDTLAYREKAICLYDLNKFAEALNVLKTSVSVKNTFAEGYYWMGKCYEKLDKRNEAISNYRLVLQIDADYAEAKEALNRLK